MATLSKARCVLLMRNIWLVCVRLRKPFAADFTIRDLLRLRSISLRWIVPPRRDDTKFIAQARIIFYERVRDNAFHL